VREEGGNVEEAESLVEVATDKVDAEVPATAAGTLTKILKGPDDVVKVGEALAEIEPGGSGASADLTSAAGEGDADIGDDADAATLQAEYQGDESGGDSGGAAGGTTPKPAALAIPELGESAPE